MAWRRTCIESGDIHACRVPCVSMYVSNVTSLLMERMHTVLTTDTKRANLTEPFYKAQIDVPIS